MMTALLLVLLAAAPAETPEKAATTTCARGSHTTLDLEILGRPKMLVMDADFGTDRLILRSSAGKPITTKTISDGRWMCLGFNPTKARYLVGSYSQVGAWLVLSDIIYLPEIGGDLLPSAFSRQELIALTSVISPSGRYVAFVGGGRVSADALYVLDTETDQIKRLGRPPMPPPTGNDFACGDRFAWGSCYADGYTAIEPSVMHFEGDNTLVVTRGRDTIRHRAKERRTEKFKF